MFGIELPTFSQVFGSGSILENALGKGSLLEQGGFNAAGVSAKISEGALRVFGDAVGHITGTNALRKSLSDQASAIRSYQEGQTRLMQEEQQRKYQQDSLASRTAGASQARSLGLSYSSGGSSFNSSDLYIGGL